MNKDIKSNVLCNTCFFHNKCDIEDKHREVYDNVINIFTKYNLDSLSLEISCTQYILKELMELQIKMNTMGVKTNKEDE